MDQGQYKRLIHILKKAEFVPSNFKSCIDTISDNLSFDITQKFQLYTLLSEKKDCIFSYIGLKNDIINVSKNTSMNMACHIGVHMITDEHTHKHYSSLEDEMYSVLTCLDDANKKILKLQTIDEYFSGSLYIQYREFFMEFKDILEQSYDYEIRRYAGKIMSSPEYGKFMDGTIDTIV